MEEINYNLIYKVHFQGISTDKEDLRLTFHSLNNEYLLEDFPKFLLLINDLSRKKKTYSFGNIKEIIPLGQASPFKIAQYFVVMYTEQVMDKSPKKNGLLIGKIEDTKYNVLGVWPVITNDQQISFKSNFNNILSEIIEKPQKFVDILLIS
jgi:hypothetical protein